MWRSYGGFTFAFEDYLKVGLSDYLDDQLSVEGFAKMDPITFPQQLSKIPTVVVMSSNDEFMQLDWSSIWGDELGLFDGKYGEMHLQIAHSDHSPILIFTGGGSIVTTLARSVALGKTAAVWLQNQQINQIKAMGL
jgi:PhoPQ-activated pathogenicity-related protein